MSRIQKREATYSAFFKTKIKETWDIQHHFQNHKKTDQHSRKENVSDFISAEQKRKKHKNTWSSTTKVEKTDQQPNKGNGSRSTSVEQKEN